MLKTLEEAIKFRDDFLKNLAKERTHNTEDIPVIYMYNMPEQGCKIDADMFDILSKYNWSVYKNKDGTTTRPSGRVNGIQEKLHTYVYRTFIGEIPEGKTIDHKQNDFFDVRRQSLRLADASVQAHNKKTQQGYKGIVFTSSAKCQVYINNKYYGTFNTAEEAAEKANEVFKEIYGDEATLNVIDYTKKVVRIPEDQITRDFILGISKVVDLQYIVKIKNLGGRGAIIKEKIKMATLEEYKKLVADKLFPEKNS